MADEFRCRYVHPRVEEVVVAAPLQPTHNPIEELRAARAAPGELLVQYQWGYTARVQLAREFAGEGYVPYHLSAWDRRLFVMVEFAYRPDEQTAAGTIDVLAAADRVGAIIPTILQTAKEIITTHLKLTRRCPAALSAAHVADRLLAGGHAALGQAMRYVALEALLFAPHGRGAERRGGDLTVEHLGGTRAYRIEWCPAPLSETVFGSSE